MKLFTGSINIDNYGIELYFIINELSYSIFQTRDAVYVSQDYIKVPKLIIKNRVIL